MGGWDKCGKGGIRSRRAVRSDDPDDPGQMTVEFESSL